MLQATGNPFREEVSTPAHLEAIAQIHYCTVVDGVEGCCPEGKICTSTSDECANTSYLPCESYDFCCPPASTCTLDYLGEPLCKVTHYDDYTTTNRATTTEHTTTAATTNPAAAQVQEATDATSAVISTTPVAPAGGAPTNMANSGASSISSTPRSTPSDVFTVGSSANGGTVIKFKEGCGLLVTVVIFALNHVLVVT
ncbi:hypothetical protein FRC05_009201 [Tulasnella sp. 425]|nr:hypothetical protein FRC05_009201 [Tulasnella sp. 425]